LLTSEQAGVVRGRVGVDALHGLALDSTEKPVEELLADFIKGECARPFAYGFSDCGSTADRWVRRALGFSPMAVYGMAYSGPTEAEAWLRQPGGLAVAFNRVMRASGLRRTKEPRPGDIGLVFAGQGRLAVAIHAGRCWFSHDEHGLIAAPLDAVWKAWSVECRKQSR
jgi:hypothetical protein